MSTYINADDGIVSGVAGLKYGSDSSGNLVLQTNGTNAISISSAQVVTFTNAVNFSSGSFTSITDSGNLTFTGAGNRITGDFSNSTVSNRVAFQTSTTNADSYITTIPNGTGTRSGIQAWGNSDPTNASGLQLFLNAAETTIRSAISGTGTYLPLTMYTGGSERMRIDTSGNVGIGGANDASYGKLQVLGSGYQALSVKSTDASAVNVVLAANSNNDARLNVTSNHPLVFYTNNTDRMRIASDGAVAINTIPNTGYITGNKFEVYAGGLGTTAGDIVSASLLSSLDANVTTFQTFAYRVSNGSSHGTSEWRQQRIVDVSRMGYMGYGSNYIAFGQNTTEQMRIDSSGNVAIGVSAGSGKFRVYEGNSSDCTINFEAAVANYAVNLTLWGNNAGGSRYNNITSKYGATEQWYIGGLGVDATLGFKTGGSERMRITSGGDLLLGTTSNLGARFAVYGTGGGTNNYIQITNPGYGTGTLGVLGTSPNFKIYNSYSSGTLGTGAGIDIDTAGNVLVGQTSATLGGKFEVNGAVAGQSTVRYPFIGSSTGTALVIDGSGYFKASSSSRRYKENIEPIDIGLSFVLSLDPVKYDLKEGSIPQVGFIAEDFPDARLVGKSLVDPLDPEKGEQIESVNYANLNAVLVKAIQELNAKVTALEAQLAAK